ncbi:MAG: AMP-binding protein, partial [Bdellovibrionales bacterium]|nr:AMP-binding protein [Bdellovibrionales bacterium]
MKNLPQALFSRADESPDSTAARYKFKDRWFEVSWLKLKNRTEILALALRALGVEHGDRVAILSETRLEWWITDLAILGAGFVGVPVYPDISKEEMAYILNDSKARILILENQTSINKWKSLCKQCPNVEKVVVMEAISNKDEEILSWQEFLELGEDQLEKEPEFYQKSVSALKASDLATLVYTSGTTGAPKGVVLTHEQIFSEVTDLFSALPVNEQDETLSFLPYSHVMGRVESWGSVWVGYVLNFAESIDQLSKNIKETRPTVLIGVPRIFEKIHSQIRDRM